MRRWNRAAYDAALKKCTSPIEQRLLAPLMLIQPVFLDRDLRGCLLTDHPEMRLIPQHQVHVYRADFALIVTPRHTPEFRLAIECDGHEFHDATKEAAARDKRRNRHFHNLGWTVARFSGSEIYGNARGVAAQIADMVDSHYANRIKADAEVNWRREQMEGVA